MTVTRRTGKLPPFARVWESYEIVSIFKFSVSYFSSVVSPLFIPCFYSYVHYIHHLKHKFHLNNFIPHTTFADRHYRNQVN